MRNTGPPEYSWSSINEDYWPFYMHPEKLQMKLSHFDPAKTSPECWNLGLFLTPLKIIWTFAVSQTHEFNAVELCAFDTGLFWHWDGLATRPGCILLSHPMAAGIGSSPPWSGLSGYRNTFFILLGLLRTSLCSESILTRVFIWNIISWLTMILFTIRIVKSLLLHTRRIRKRKIKAMNNMFAVI